LNRRPADYETFHSSQIAENADRRESFTPATEPIVAQVEQVSEQVATPIPLLTTTIVECAPAALVSEDTQLRESALFNALFDPESLVFSRLSRTHSIDSTFRNRRLEVISSG
jgi:hypothetical protein